MEYGGAGILVYDIDRAYGLRAPVEVVFAGGKVERTGDRFGIGRRPSTSSTAVR